MIQSRGTTLVGGTIAATLIDAFVQTMPNIGTVLRDEVVRLSRKVQKQGLTPLQKASAGYRRDIAQLKREVTAIQRELARVRKGQSAKLASQAESDSGTSLRFQAKGLKSMRARLDLSANDFGKLIGVSGQTIYNWESEKATPRRSQLHALAGVRGIGKKEARARLDGSVPEA